MYECRTWKFSILKQCIYIYIHLLPFLRVRDLGMALLSDSGSESLVGFSAAVGQGCSLT